MKSLSVLFSLDPSDGGTQVYNLDSLYRFSLFVKEIQNHLQLFHITSKDKKSWMLVVYGPQTLSGIYLNIMRHFSTSNGVSLGCYYTQIIP